jgi:branched-chain amino acid transport system permease protein
MKIASDIGMDRQLRPPIRLAGRHMEATIAAIAFIFIYFVWMGSDFYRQDLVTFGCVYSLVALGMYIPLVMSGSLSVSYNSYFAVGAYAIGIFFGNDFLSQIAAVPAGLIIAVLVALGIGFVSRGLTGYHLAVATLAVAQASDRLLVHADAITGGATGISNIARPVIFGWQLSRAALLGIGLIVVFLAAAAVNRLRDSVWGLSIRMQRDSQLAAEACGVPTELCRTMTLVIGAAIASLGGALYALINQLIIPESFTLAIVFTVIFIPIIGGSQSAWGCVVGTVAVLVVNEVGSQLDLSGSLVFGAGVLAVLLIAPTGILGMTYAGLRLLANGKADKTSTGAPVT